MKQRVFTPPRPRRLFLTALALLAAVLLALIGGFSLWANARIAALETRDPAEGAPGQIVEVRGYRLHVQTLGAAQADPAGVPLMLIHGFASSGREFGRLAPLLADGRRLIVPDLLGYGYSQRVVEPTADYSHRGQAALLAGLLDELGVETVDVAGSSYGGAIAAQFALDYPERVRRIVFIDAQIYEVGNAGGQAVADLPFGLNRALTWSTLGDGPFSSFLLSSVCYDIAACLEAGEFAGARTELSRIRGATEALIAFSRSPRDQRVPAEIGQVRAPALVIWGRADQIVPPQDGERLARDLPDARLEWIEAAGHVPHIERPDVAAGLITAFLGQ